MADDTQFEEELNAGTHRGQTLLDKLQFAEAEAVYRQVLRQCELSTPHPTQRHQAAVERATVTAVSGLAETYSRQSRTVTTDDDVTHWMRLMVQSVCLHREVVELCRRALKRRSASSRQVPADDVRFFDEALSLSSSRSKLLEDALVTTVKNQLIQKTVRSHHWPPQSQMRQSTSSEWLHNVLSRCSESSTGTEYDDTQTDTTESLSSRSSSSSVVGPDWTSPLPAVDTTPDTSKRVRRRRINFDKIQNAIKQLVSEASSEVRSHYGHLVTTGSITQSLLQRRVTSELMVRLARTGRQGSELKDLLQDSITYEEEWQEDKDDSLPHSPLSNTDKSCSPQPLCDMDELESNPDDDNTYETVYIECPATTIEHLGHVIINRSSQSINTAAGEAGKPAPAAQPDSSRSSNRVTVLGLNKFGQKDEYDGIITVWKSYGSVDDEGEGQLDNASTPHQEQLPGLPAQQPQQPQLTPGQVARALLRLPRLPSFDEVSPLTERDRVFRWLETTPDDVTEDQLPASSSGSAVDSASAAGSLSPSKLSQTVGLVSLQVADQLRGDSRYREAYDVYNYALGIFQDHPPGATEDDVERRKVVAGLLRDIGIVKCNLGDMAAGCQLMEESACLYEWNKNNTDLTKVAEVWYALGNVFLTDDLRGNSLLDHMMQLTQKALKEVGEEDADSNDDDDQMSVTDEQPADDDDHEDSYSVCTHEAIVCYQRTLTLLDRHRTTSSHPELTSELAELYAGTLSKLADCYVLTSQLDRAIVHYERTLPYFHLAAVGGALDRRLELLALNAHVLSQLGTVNFLLRNYWRGAAIYETAMMLRHQLTASEQKTPESGCLEAAWLYTMYGLTCGTLGRDHQCVVWCLRAFAGYVAVLRGKILDVEPLRRWFVVETLYALGRAYGVVENGAAKAIHYLTVAKNLACAAPDDQLDYPQTIEVLDSLAEACEALGDSDGAHRYEMEATEMASTFYRDKPPVTINTLPTETRSRPDETPDDSTLPETVIREGAQTLISKLGLKTAADVGWSRGEMSADETSIRTAERELHEAVCKAGGAAVIALATSDVYTNKSSASSSLASSRSQTPTGRAADPSSRSCLSPSPAVKTERRNASPRQTSSSPATSTSPATAVSPCREIPADSRHSSTANSRGLTVDTPPTSSNGPVSAHQQRSTTTTDYSTTRSRLSTNTQNTTVASTMSPSHRPTAQTPPASSNAHQPSPTPNGYNSPPPATASNNSNINSVRLQRRSRDGAVLNGLTSTTPSASVRTSTQTPVNDNKSSQLPSITGQASNSDEWVTFEEVVETPADLLNIIRSKKRVS